MLAGGVVTAIAFVLNEAKFAKFSLFPRIAFKQRRTIISLAVTFLNFVSFYLLLTFQYSCQYPAGPMYDFLLKHCFFNHLGHVPELGNARPGIVRVSRVPTQISDPALDGVVIGTSPQALGTVRDHFRASHRVFPRRRSRQAANRCSQQRATGWEFAPAADGPSFIFPQVQLCMNLACSGGIRQDLRDRKSVV